MVGKHGGVDGWVNQHYEAADSEPAASTVPHPESRILRPLVFRDSASCCSEDRITPFSNRTQMPLKTLERSITVSFYLKLSK